MSTYAPAPVTFVRGEGSRLFDSKGRAYLDFLGGLAVTSLGHCHPAVTRAIAAQAATLMHVSNLFSNNVGPQLAATIDRLLGGGGRVFLCNSGAEANECAMKLARRWARRHDDTPAGPGRHEVVSLNRSFHGRTLAALAATGQRAKHAPFLPLPAGYHHIDAGDSVALRRVMADGQVAAVLVESLQGEGGVNEIPDSWLREVQAQCREANALLIVDEVQTGLGRTGKWFGFEHSGIRPDVVTLAKALGNGMPIGACWARGEVADAFSAGDHGTTFGGQPMAAAAAAAVLAELEALDAPKLAAQAGSRLRSGVAALPGVAGVRGRGLLLAMELESVSSVRLARRALDAGLIVNAVTPTAIRLAPSLLVSGSEIDEALTIFRRLLTDPESD